MKSEMFNALFNLQQEVGDLVKDTKNPFFKSQYADLNQVLDMLKPLLIKYKLVLIQIPTMLDGKSVLLTRIQHESGDFVEGTAELIVKDNDPQKLGSSITYMRRYSLISMFGLKAVDDDGNHASGNKVPSVRTHASEGLHSKEAYETIYDEMIKLINTADVDFIDDLPKDKKWDQWVKYLDKNAPDLLAEVRVKYQERKQELKG